MPSCKFKLITSEFTGHEQVESTFTVLHLLPASIIHKVLYSYIFLHTIDKEHLFINCILSYYI